AARSAAALLFALVCLFLSCAVLVAPGAGLWVGRNALYPADRRCSVARCRSAALRAAASFPRAEAAGGACGARAAGRCGAVACGGLACGAGGLARCGDDLGPAAAPGGPPPRLPCSGPSAATG